MVEESKIFNDIATSKRANNRRYLIWLDIDKGPGRRFGKFRGCSGGRRDCLQNGHQSFCCPHLEFSTGVCFLVNTRP